MDGEWPVQRLGDLTYNHDARRVPVKETDRRTGPYPYYGASGIVDYIDGFIFDGDYLLVAEDGENLRTKQTPVAFMATGQFWVNNHAHILTGNGRALTRYLHYALQIIDIAPFLTGAVMPKLTQFSLNRVEIPTPPLETQEAITKLFSALDDKIELNLRMAETLEATARALFKSWFIDSDPVNSKAETRPTGLPDAVAALFPNRLAGDGLPVGWAPTLLGKIVNQARETIDPAPLGDTLVDHFSLPAFDAGRRASTEPACAIKSLKLSVSPPVVLFSKLNPNTPRVWAVHEQGVRPMLASTEFLALRPISADIPFSFVEGLLKSDPFREKASGMVTGTSKSHQRIQPAALLATEWLMPSRPVLAAFDQIAGAALKRRGSLVEENATLAALRDTLLPKIISGELRIHEGERAVAAA